MNVQVKEDGKIVIETPPSKAGDYLLFASARGDRDVIRLTETPAILPKDPVSGSPTSLLTVVHWGPATPLGHDFCIAETTVAGNLVVATHGETVTEKLRDLTSEDSACRHLRPPFEAPWFKQMPESRLIKTAHQLKSRNGLRGHRYVQSMRGWRSPKVTLSGKPLTSSSALR